MEDSSKATNSWSSWRRWRYRPLCWHRRATNRWIAPSELCEAQWFKNMRGEVKAYVESCKCQVANLSNPNPPLKLRLLPLEPLTSNFVNYTQMDRYSRYIWPDRRSWRRPSATWSGTHTPGRDLECCGPPNNSYEWETWVSHGRAKPKKTTPYNPPANRMVERFYQGWKLVILVAF